MRRLIRIIFVFVLALTLCSSVSASLKSPKEVKKEPTFRHGAGQVLYGLFLEFPKTTLDATLNGPPVVGTMVGALAGFKQGIHKIIMGIGEISEAIGP